MTGMRNCAVTALRVSEEAYSSCGLCMCEKEREKEREHMTNIDQTETSEQLAVGIDGLCSRVVTSAASFGWERGLSLAHLIQLYPATYSSSSLKEWEFSNSQEICTIVPKEKALQKGIRESPLDYLRTACDQFDPDRLCALM